MTSNVKANSIPSSDYQEVPPRKPSVDNDNAGRIPVIGVYNMQTDRNWSQWTGDQFQAGLGQAIQALVAGIIMGLGNALIQKAGEKINEKNIETPSKVNIDRQVLKIALVISDCDELIDSSGRVKRAVFELLERAEKEEANNYPAYFMGLAKCINEYKMKKSGNPA